MKKHKYRIDSLYKDLDSSGEYFFDTGYKFLMFDKNSVENVYDKTDWYEIKVINSCIDYNFPDFSTDFTI